MAYVMFLRLPNFRLEIPHSNVCDKLHTTRSKQVPAGMSNHLYFIILYQQVSWRQSNSFYERSFICTSEKLWGTRQNQLRDNDCRCATECPAVQFTLHPEGYWVGRTDFSKQIGLKVPSNHYCSNSVCCF